MSALKSLWRRIKDRCFPQSGPVALVMCRSLPDGTWTDWELCDRDTLIAYHRRDGKRKRV